MRPAADGLLFGTAGVPLSSTDASTFSAIEHIRAIGLDCLEVEFVKGVKMSRETADKIGRRAKEIGIRLSVHAPYFINLNSEDRGKRLMSQERLLNSARLAGVLGARSVVFHAGFYGRETPEKAYAEIKAELSQVLSIVRTERLGVTMRIETMGKRSQFGTFDEVLQLSKEIEGLRPCLDFCHLHSREGRVNTYLDFQRVLGKVGKKLGREALQDLHIHIAGVHYNDTGELKHLNLQESDFRYNEWLKALRDVDAAGLVICESPNLEQDALFIKRLYEARAVKH
jgi:deoxyribonuclease-4